MGNIKDLVAQNTVDFTSDEVKTLSDDLITARLRVSGVAYKPHNIGDSFEPRAIGSKVRLTGVGEFTHVWKIEGQKPQYGPAFEAIDLESNETIWLSQRAIMQQKNIKGYLTTGEIKTYTDANNSLNEHTYTLNCAVNENQYKASVPVWPTRDELEWFIWATKNQVLKDLVLVYHGMAGRTYTAKEGNKITEIVNHEPVHVEAGATRAVTLKVWLIEELIYRAKAL